MYKIKIKHIILILLFIFVIYNFFTYKEHFDFETKITMPGQLLSPTYTIPKLVFKSYEGCPKLYHIFQGLKDDEGNTENVDGLRFKNKIVSKFFNLENIVIEERPIIDISRKRFSVNLGNNIYLLFLKEGYNQNINTITLDELLKSTDNKILEYDTILGSSKCLITDGTLDDNCKPIEVYSLLPYLEEKKNFIDRVMPLIIGKVDGKFIRYLIDYKSIINQEYTKLNRIKESTEFIYQSELDSYYALSVVQENTDSDSNTNVYETYQTQNYVTDEHNLFYETIGYNTSTKYKFTQLFSYIHKYFNDLHTFYDFIINENPFQEFEDIMDNMDVALGKFISQKNSIKLKYKELCELIFDYLYVELDTLNLKTEVEKLKILKDKENIIDVTIDGTPMSIPQKIIDIKDVLDTEIESLNNDYKSFIDNITEKLINIDPEFNSYKDYFVNINDVQFDDITSIYSNNSFDTTQYVPILNQLYLKGVDNSFAEPNYKAYFEKRKNNFTTELELDLERLEYLEGEKVDTYSEEIQNFIDTNLDMSVPTSLFFKIYNLISSENFFILLETFKNEYIENYISSIKQLIDTIKLNIDIFTKQFLNNIVSINDYLIDIPQVGVEPSVINYSNFVDKLISFYNKNPSPIDTTLTYLINNHFLAELASEYQTKIIGVLGNNDINLIFTSSDEIKTNIQTFYQNYKTQKQADDEDMKLLWATNYKDNYENINLYNNDLIHMYESYQLIYLYLEGGIEINELDSGIKKNELLQTKKLELLNLGLKLTSREEYDNKLKFERTEETTNKLKEIMKNLLNFIKINKGADNLDLKPNLEFKYNDDSDSIEYDKENHIEQDEKQVISKVKVDFTEDDVVNFTEYCFNELCRGIISIDKLAFTGNHFRAYPCQNSNCNNFYELPERIRKQAMEEGKEYTRAKCAGCGSNIIIYFDKFPKLFNEYGNLNEEPDGVNDKKIEDLI